MHRALGRLVSLFALLVALMIPSAAFAAAPDTSDVLVLAVEEGPPAGLEPRAPDDPDNAFGPVEYEYNYLWGAAVGLLVLVAGGFALVGGLYYLKVVKPSQVAN